MPEARRGPSKLAFAHVLRGFAALCVVIAHCVSAFWVLPNYSLVLNLPRLPESIANPAIVQVVSVVHYHAWGGFGVALFFVISGFVIPFTLLTRDGGGFLVARILRVWPTLVVALLVTTGAVAIATWIEDRPLPWTVGDVLVNFSLFGNYLGARRIDAVVWTLEIELKFYFLVALFSGVVVRGQLARLVAIATALATVAAVVELWLATHTDISAAWHLTLRYVCTDAHMIAYMLIGTLFNLYHRGAITLRAAVIAIAGLTLVNAVLWFRAPNSHGVPVTLMLCYAGAVVLFALCYRLRAWFGTTGPWTRLADISYPLYLCHAALGVVIMNMLVRRDVSPTLALVVAFAVIFCIAIVVHHLVEVPTRQAGRRLGARFDAWWRTRAGAARTPLESGTHP